ncbi:MAG: NADH-quinone oxidoreductase subunit N [Bacteroidetes bacterium]|nr:NADH-quinone oxidoreductase subunit N [Bacteroidota bacterium]
MPASAAPANNDRFMSQIDLLTALPIEIVSAFALLVMLADALVEKSTKLCSALAVIGFVGGIVAAILPLTGAIPAMHGTMDGFNGMIRTGGMSAIYDIVFCAAAIIAVLLSTDYLRRVGGMYDEFYTLVAMSVAGMMLIAHANDLMILFVGVEVMSIAFYVLAGLVRGSIGSNEAAMKYFLLGAFASGFLLYGIALVYGAVGDTTYKAIVSAAAASQYPALLWAGVGLIVVGLGFKVAAFPFHQWAPDVYQGAPTVVTGFMSTAGKAAAFSGFIGVIAAVAASGAHDFNRVRFIVAILAVCSMLVGNITAIAQTNIKRMLAYSSVAHAGYMLIGIAAANNTGFNGITYYLAAYLFMQVGAFAIVGMLERENGGNLSIEDYRGLGRRRPGLAIVMAIFMFSLTGIPPFAGFFGKYYLFAAAIESGMTWLAIVGVVASVISAWFYLGLIVAMFFREPSGEAAAENSISGLSKTALALSIAGTLIVGFLPELFLRVLAH